ncbi:alpha-L-rhamnosidase [Sphingobium sp. AP50]|uniref:alpha-L-rhamnosidase n=1 Tax=Sphingobium sp. AP50 TaxID=1884369 RepID=UPI001C431F4D|nr:alpha-L-rhamnosidase [Sphingobium sp. AP50]
MQSGYELQVAKDVMFTRSVEESGFVETGMPYLAPWPAKALRSREIRWWRVRVHTDLGWTSWSNPARVEASLLTHEDWVAQPITPLSNQRRVERSSVPYLRREFTLDEECVKARLYVTALGIHDIHINGRSVSEDLLEPGWTVYPGRHLFSSYDVTALIAQGDNAISSAVGDGWWRGELAWMKRRAIYGDTTALLAQLEIETVAGRRLTIATDRSWRGGYGGLKQAELYDGCKLDLRAEPRGWRMPKFDDSDWEEVATLDLPMVLEARTFPGVQIVKRFPPATVVHDGDLIRIDAGQNLSGFLSIRVDGPADATITVRHAELLDDEGRLHTAPLRNAKATDHFILNGTGEATLFPLFTFHGFRHAELEISPGVKIVAIEVIVAGTALDYRGDFECSDPAVNKLFHNTVWSQRGNFLALPTDCPQRDERLGWTGDIQVFAETACLNANCRTFLASWLKDLELEQRHDGCVPATVPNVIQGHHFEYGGVGWGDAATLVPWMLYTAYGDMSVLRRQYGSMKRWVDYGLSRRDLTGCWTGDFQLGDWLDPGAPSDQPHKATTDSDFIATAFLSFSAGRLAQVAALIGFDEDAKVYALRSKQVSQAAWTRWSEQVLNSQTGCAISIMFNIAPEKLHLSIGTKLAELVEQNGNRVATGFLGTPLILPALTRTSQTEAAFALLLNRDCPGWLYQVDRGATTMWERWDAVREDGSLHRGDMSTAQGATMISYNHYAYGAVSAWLYNSVAGIAADEMVPAYGHTIFAPQLGGALMSARASVQSPYGLTRIEWKKTAKQCVVHIDVPPGATGSFITPPGYEMLEPSSVLLDSGTHTIFLDQQG